MRVIMTLKTKDHVKDEDILTEESIIRIEVEDHWIEKITKIEDIEEGEDPLMMEDHLMMEDPLIMEDPLMMEGPRKWKTAKKTWKTRTTRPTRTSWTSAPYNCTTAPGYSRYYCSRKHIWYSW